MPKDRPYLAGWSWVRFADISRFLCEMASSIQNPSTVMPVGSVGELLDRYGLLCGHCGGTEVLTWIGQGSYAIDSRIRPDDGLGHSVFFPVGFSNAVIDLVRQGIDRVIAVPFPSGSLVGDSSFVGHSLMGCHTDGTWFNIIIRGRHGPYELVKQQSQG